MRLSDYGEIRVDVLISGGRRYPFFMPGEDGMPDQESKIYLELLSEGRTKIVVDGTAYWKVLDQKEDVEITFRRKTPLALGLRKLCYRRL